MAALKEKVSIRKTDTGFEVTNFVCTSRFGAVIKNQWRDKPVVGGLENPLFGIEKIKILEIFDEKLTSSGPVDPGYVLADGRMIGWVSPEPAYWRRGMIVEVVNPSHD